MAFFKSLLNRLMPSSNRVDELDAGDHYERLERLRIQHDWIDVKLTGHDRSYQSLVLDIDLDNKELVIDDLYPPEGLDSIEPGDTVEISSQARYALIHFYTRVLARQQRDGQPCYRLELPEEVGLNHGRGAYRVYVEPENGLDIDIDLRGESLIDVRVINLSAEGVKLSFANDISDQLGDNITLKNCLMRLPGGEDIDCDITLRNIYRMRSPHTHTLGGGQLVINNPQQRIKLQQYLAAVQRKQRRRETRT